MDKMMLIERLRYVKICGERTFFRDLINNSPEKGKNLKPKGSLRVLPLLCLLFRSNPPKIILESSWTKISQSSIEKPAMDFCFSFRA